MAGKEWLNDKAGPFMRRYNSAARWAARSLERLAERYAWVAVGEQAVRGFLRHGMTLHAGNFAYSSFLAVFPLALLAAAAIGFFFNYSPEMMHKATEAIKSLLPDMPATVNAASHSLVRLRNVVGVLGVIGLLWSISKIAYAIEAGFEEVWETHKRSFVKKKLFAFGVMLLLLLVAAVGFIATFISSQFFSWLSREAGPIVSALSVVFTAILNPMASVFIFATLYRSIPLDKPGWKEVLWGAVIAALLLSASEYALGFYFTRISRNQALYGSLGVVLGVVLWLYVVGILVFMGAEIVHALQLRRGGGGARQKPPGVQLKLPWEEA